GRRIFNVDWDTLQKPGFSADFTQRQNWMMPTDLKASDWIPTVAAKALMRKNRPLLAYIGGKPGAFTSKGHNFRPGETFSKQLIVINNSRESVKCSFSWSFTSGKHAGGEGTFFVRTGEQERIRLEVKLPIDLDPGSYDLSAVVKFSTGETQ